MKKFYFTLTSLISHVFATPLLVFFTARRCWYSSPTKRGPSCIIINAMLLSLLFNTQIVVHAQEATFFENFDNTATGELPEGWSWYQNGGTDPGSHWMVSTYGFFGPRVAWSNWTDAAAEGELDADWLITPQITPATGDYLIFNGAQEFVSDDFGSRLHILISTTTADPEAFEDTLVTYTETEFPGYLSSAAVQVDLAAYANTPIYIAFVHENPSVDIDQAEDFYFDNIWVRPVQEAAFYSAEVYFQGRHPVPVGRSVTYIILGAKVRVIGDYGLANITALSFAATGTVDPSLLTEAKLYTTGKDDFISTDEEAGTVNGTLFGTVSAPGENFTVTGNHDLAIGDNYFWLVLVIDPTLTPEYPYPNIDAALQNVTVNGTVEEATVGTKDGYADIVPNTPSNDFMAKAIEVTTAPARYGSYNNRATFEPAVEKLAYCAPGGTDDVFNTIWWHFKAPGEGFITADLSATTFNTLLVFQDKDFMQLACNDDMDATHVQSRIEDFPVAKDQDIYIRVSGKGALADPNGAAGVVIMDFRFTTPLGTEDQGSSYRFSLPYPNPANNYTSVDVVLHAPTEVMLDVYDMVGRPVLTHNAGVLAAGTQHTISLDVSALLPGTYLIKVRGNAAQRTHKLIVTR